MKKFLLSSIMSCILATTCSIIPSFVKPINTSAEEIELSSKSACLVDYSSGATLYAKDETKHLPVASMVKMMTILLTLEEIDSGRMTLESMITTSENASGMGGSQVFIDPYVEYSAEDLLKSVIMASANDASVALAEQIAGNESAFVVKMNEKAKSLGMNDTNYSNCTGLPAPEQYSSAKDSALLLKEVVSHDIYHKYSTIWMDELVHPSGRKTGLVNTNRLVRYYDGCDGGKTGSTNEAGCCLSASAMRNNMRLISVIVGAENSQTRFNECTKLFNYGFANFENKPLLKSDSAVKQLHVDKGKLDNVDVFAEKDFSVVIKKGSENEYAVTYNLPSSVKAPTKHGEKVGSAIIAKDGQVVEEVNLIVKEDIGKLSYFDCAKEILHQW